MKSGKDYSKKLLLAATLISLSTTMPMNVAWADDPTPTRGAYAAYTITNGTADNHNFTTSDGSTTSYYKTNLSVFNLLNNINGSTVWLEGTQGNNNFSVVLPNNETRYFIYGYTKPDGWGDGERQSYDYNGNAAGNSSFYNNRTFNGLNSTVSGGAIDIQAKYQATTGSNLIGSMTADFINNSITNTDTSEKGLGGALHIWGPYAGIETLNSNFINNHITYNSTKSGGGALAIGEGYNGGESTVGLINGNFINNYIDAPSSNFGGAIYYEGSSYGNGEITSIGQDPVHTTKFVGNHILGTGQGGAIYAVNKIGSIYADFIGNYIAGLSDNSKGGAISLTKTSDEKNVGSITGDFIGNYITTSANNGTAWGGAIYNNNSVGSITGDFIGNYVVSEQGDTYGGAIYNTGTITTLTSNFIDNYANGKNVYGGAIYNTGTITTLNGKFIENDAYANVPYGFNAVGGAIANKDNGVIENISGDFIRNKAHSYTSSSSMYARGGAIYNEGAKIGTINANFIENEAQRQAGAIYNNGNSSYNKGIGTISGNFIKNKVTGEIARELYGGAIFNEGTIGDITANFTSNSTQAQSDNNQYYNAFGGAIANNGSDSSLGDITGVFDGNSSVHNFAKVDTGNYYGAFGGAIYNNGGKIGTYEMDEYDEPVYTGGIKSSTFQNNKAESNQAAQGGAIWTNRQLNLIDTSFVNNSAISSAGKSYGGAIYAKDYNSSFENLGVISVKAKTANVTFSGNKAENGAAIYSESNGGTFISAEGGNILFENNNKTGAANGTGTGIYTASTLFLNTENEHTIIINDNIDTSGGYGWGYLDVTPAGGNIYLNGSITTGSSAGIRMGYSESDGALVLGQTPANQTFNSLTAQNDSTLSLQNNHAGDNLVVNTFTGSDWGSLKFNIDYDATANSMDKITVNSGSGTITLNAVNVMNDNTSFVDGTEATYLDGTARNNITVITDAIQSTVAGTTVYTFTPDSTTHGLLTVSRNDAPYTGDLINAIQDTETVHPTAYSMQENFTADRNFGALNTDNRDDFTIFGNNHTISGANTYTGIEVANGQILNLDSVVFSNVKTYDVQNKGTLNLSGTNTIKTITDAAIPIGVTNITGGTTRIASNGSATQDTINLQGGNLKLLSGSSIVADIIADSTLDTTGRLEVNDATITGTISGTFKGNTGTTSALYFMSPTLANNNLALNGVNFDSNSGNVSGGLVFYGSGNLTLTNNQFTNNTALNGAAGALLVQATGATSITGATFTGNSATSSSGTSYGGAIYQQGGTLTISGATFDGNSVEGSSGGSGGAIYSNGTALTITGTAENPTVFKNNGISKYDNNYQGSAYGGAIYQENGTLNISNAKFENNVSDFNIKSNLYGGAIYSEATGGNISADFTGNTLSAVAGSAQGGAIYNEGTLTKITGDFTNNAITLQPTSSSEQYGESSGGAIANGGTITNGIDGTFSGNTITTNVKQSDANGGAIANGGTIGNITGDFLNNSVASTNTTYSGSARGGAIYNLNGTIGNIIATSAEENGFKGNSATKAAGYNAEGLGGAIYNHAEGYNTTIGNITADFINNTATTNGGAIYNYAADNNKAEIGNIIGNFTGNTAYQGSAIYNYVNNDESYIDNKLAIIGDITGNFSENNGTVIYNKGYYDYNNFNETVYAQIGDITGDFTENNASSGNIIYNDYAQIGDIIGDFTENTTNNGVINNSGSIDSITANTTTQKGFYKNTGSAIRNYASADYHREATIGNITADFKENNAGAYSGAAINNSSANANLKAKIGNITGDFDQNASTNYGGAISNTYAIIGTQNNLGEFTGTAITGNFTNNQVTNNSVYNPSGGAIANENSSSIGNIQGNFENNSIINSRYKAMGGAIANRNSSTIGNITGNFNTNTISYDPAFDTDTDFAQHYGNSSLGGAIYNDSTSTIGALTGDFVGNWAKGHVAEDDTTTVFAAAGGAIYNEGTLGTITGDIKNNYALGHSHHGVYGGAIYTTTGLNLVDSDITGNYVTTQSTSATDLKGGAIYTTDGINITASTKNISVSGNKGTEQGAAIYNASENNAVVLNATGGNITFENNNLTGLSNGSGVGIYSAGGLTLNAADGKYISLNDALNITGNTTLNGTLKLGDNAVETLANTTSKFIAQGGTLDIANGAIDTMTFANAVDIQNAISLGLDVNLTGTTTTADKITADITSGNTSAITLSALNFINDNYTGSEEDHELTIASGTIKSLINENITSTTGNTNSYSYSYDQNTGILTVSLVTYDNIYDAVHDTEKATRTYKIKLAEGETITQALGALAGTKLTVNGNNKYLDGDSKGGITVANGQTLELKNISQVKNFTTAVDNAGTLNVEGVTFTTNTTDINNTAILNLSGDNVINTITGNAGTTNITGGLTTIDYNGSVTQNAVNMHGGGLLIRNHANVNKIVGDENHTGSYIVAYGGSFSSLEGTFKGSNTYRALDYNSATALTIDGVTFDNNAAGAIYHSWSGAVDSSISNSTFTNNSTEYEGGAYYQHSTNAQDHTVSFDNVTFTSNSATNHGGAIYATLNAVNNLNISDSTFTSNTVTGANGTGSAIYLEGDGIGDYEPTPSSYTINNSTFTTNGAGGVVYANGGNLTVKNSTFTSNSGDAIVLADNYQYWTIIGGQIAQVYSPITANIVAETGNVAITDNSGWGIVGNKNHETDSALTLYAKSGNITINGNTAGGINNNGLVLTLNADTGHNITINDAVSSTTGMTVNAGGTHAGTVALNGALTLGGDGLTLSGGTLKLNSTAANSIAESNLKLNGGKFDIANNAIDNLTFTNAINNAVNSYLALDVSLGDTNTADKITSDISGASTVYVSDINFISDNKNGGDVQIADGNIKSVITVSDVAGGYADVQYNNSTGVLSFADKINWLEQTNGNQSGYRFTKTNNGIMPVNYTSGENNYTFYTDILRKNYVDNNSVAHDLKYTWNNATHALTVTNSDDTAVAQTTMGVTGAGSTADPYILTGDYTGNNSSLGFARWDKVDSITGDFVGNTKGGIGVGMGITIGDITGNFIGNSSNNGGAIYTHGDGSWGSSVANVTGDFIGNRATDGSGGAINGGGNYGKNSFVTITGDFIGNSATKDGGAIDRAGRNIKGNFINNKAGIKGGAIYANGGNRIEGDFINNTAASDGGAIYASNRIGTIEGDFVNNTSGGSGGAFYGCSDIIGNFTNNTAQTNGGAIYAISSISITGDITGNSAGEAGGAIYQSTAYGSTINDSKFENNTAQTKGGAIYADIEYGSYSDSTKINNTRFINNSATGENSMGGAIYATRGGLYITDTSFTGNSASKGAAIYSANTKTRIYAKTQDIEFTNNNSTGLANGTGTGIEIEGSTFTLNADENRSIVINDAVNSTGAISINADSSNTGSVTFNGDLTQAGALTVNKGTATFNGVTNQTSGATTINNATAVFNGETTLGNVTLNSQYTTLKFGADAGNSTLGNVQFYYTGTQTFDIQNDSVGTLNVASLSGNSKAKFNIDIDFTGESVLADAINITTGGQTSNLMINSINTLTSETGAIREFTNLAILTGETDGVTLVLSEAIQQDPRFNGAAVETITWESDYTDNATFANTVFTNTEYSETKQKQLSVVDGTKLSYAETTTVPKHATGNVTTQDVLQALNQSTSATRTLTTDDATATYNVGADLGVTGVGSLSVTGTTSGTDTSTLNMNNKSGFELSNANTTLALSNLNITNINDTADGGLINITGENSSATLTSVTVGSTTNSAIVNNRTLTLAGNTTINTGIKGTGAINSNGTIALNGALTYTGDTNVSGGTLKLGSNAATSDLNAVTFTNTPTLDLQNSAAQTLTADSISSNANLNIDIDFTGDSVIADAIDITTGGQTGTLTINSIAALASDSDIKTFENLAILTGETTGVTLALSEAMQSDPRFNGAAVETITWEDDYSDTATFAQSVFTNTEYSETKQKQLSVVDNTKLSYTETTTVPKHATGNTITQDVLQALNQSTSAERSLTTDSATAVYTVGADLGTTGAGTLTVQGVSGSELSMSGKTGFELTNAGTVLNLKDLNITGLADENTSLLGIANLEGTKANLENITVSQTITKDVINNLGELNFAGTNTINSYIGGSGTTNINGGKTTLAQLAQNAVNITAGELEVANITTTNGISNADTLTLTGTSNANAITGLGHTTIAGNINNTGSIGQAITVNSSKTLTTNANLIGGAVTNSGTVELTSGTLGQTITGGNINITTGTVTSSADKLAGDVTNNSTLRLSGTLDKAISGNGVTSIDSNLKITSTGSVAGTLALNGCMLDLSGDGVATQYDVNVLDESGQLKIDIDYSGATPVADSINIATSGGAGAVMLYDITEIGTAPGSFTVEVLKGNVGSKTIEISDSLAERYQGEEETYITYESEDYNANIDFDKTSFDTIEYTEKAQKTLSVVDNVKLKLDKVTTEAKHETGRTQEDALATLNTNSGSRSMKATTTASSNAYTLTKDLGNTATGDITVEGRSATDLGTLNMNNKTGFVVANSGTEVTLKNINVNNTQNADGALVNVTNSGSSAVLDGAVVNVKDNPENKANVISSNGTVTVKDSTVNAGVNNTGTLDFEGTSSADKVAGETGTTNVKGQTTLGSLVQKLVNIVSGGKLIANGDVTTGTSTGEGINNAVANGLELNDGTLTGNVTGAGSVKTTGNSSIADGSTVSQAVTVASGKLTTSANGLGGAVTNGSEVDLTGGTLETSITGGNTTISGNVGVDDTNGSIASAVSVDTGAKLTTNASNVTGTINNGGDLDLTGGDIQNAISGEGTTTISGAVTNTTDSNIGNAVTVASTGDLTTAANKLGGAVTNAGTVKLDGGTLSQTITGGNISIIDDVDTNANNLAGATSVASEKELTLTGGELTSNVTGAGTTEIAGNVTNSANISTATNITSGSLDNTNGQLANVTITSGSLTSNADNISGTVANNGDYEITGGTIANAISGTGNVVISGNVTNSAVNTVSGMITVADGAELVDETTGNAFSNASYLNMANGSTLNLENGTSSDNAINNLFIASGDTINLKMDWKDTLTSTSTNINGNISVTEINLASTTGADDTYAFTNLGDKVSLHDPLSLTGVTSSTNNTVTYNSTTGNMSSFKKSLIHAIDTTDTGITSTYVMTSDETAGGEELYGTLKIQGNGYTINTAGIKVGSVDKTGANLTLENTNMNVAGKALEVFGGNKVTVDTKGHNISLTTTDSSEVISLNSSSGAYATAELKGEKEININGDITSDNVNNVLTIASGTTVNHNGLLDPITVDVNGTENRTDGYDELVTYNVKSGGIINFSTDSTLYDSGYHTDNSLNTINFNGGSINTVNGVATDFHLANMSLNGTSNFYGDVDLANQTMDKFTVENDVTGSGKLNVAGLNLISDAAEDKTTINFTDDSTLMAAVSYTGKQGLKALSPIYKYNVAYDKENGNFDFTRFTDRYDGYNPSVMVAPVAAQLGGYLNQLNSYDEAFYNMDMYMLMTKEQRLSLKMKNHYASADGKVLYDATLARQERPEGWFRPYATFEKVGLRNGPKVSNTMYGSFMGGESEMYDLGHGWDGMWGAYVGYNGSHQRYNGVSIYQNGGSLGLVGMAYKGNFFQGLTFNAGANGVEANTMYGNEDFAMFMTGIASKTGYNFELADSKFIIQPSWTMSYSFVNAFDYTNAAGVKIESDPLHAIQLQPEVKFIGNLKNGWQPYASVAMVWNIMDETKFTANDVSLPELSVKPYVKYGVGVRKTWGERFSGFLQTFLTNGGRNGIGVQAGFTWALGKAPEKTTNTKAGQMPEMKKTKITLNNSNVK